MKHNSRVERKKSEEDSTYAKLLTFLSTPKLLATSNANSNHSHKKHELRGPES